jgi:hypothetical protein
MRKVVTQFGVVAFLLAVAPGCRSTHGLASRSADDVNICRQFVAEAGNQMQELGRKTFHPRDLTLRQLLILTPADPDFIQAEFLVLNREWSFEEGGKQIVIICTQGRVDGQGHRKYFAAYNSGDYGWLSEEEAFKLR